MAFCKECNLEIADNRETCPLCSALLDGFKKDSFFINSWPGYRNEEAMSQIHKLLLIWIPMAVISCLACMIISGIDFFEDYHLSWSIYPVISLFIGVLYISTIFIFKRNFFIYYTWYGFVTLGLIMGIDKFISTPKWFFSLGFPIIGMIYFYGIVNFFILLGIRGRVSVYSSFNFLFASVFCIGIDALVSLHKGDSAFTWSHIVSTALVFIAVSGLFYVIYLKKQLDVGKYFHV